MKKKYEKPMIIIDDFTLCESVASGCELKSNQAQDVCAYNDNGWMTFTSAISDCMIKVDQENESEKLCYHVPIEANNIFTS